jgi:hypothetical protein
MGPKCRKDNMKLGTLFVLSAALSLIAAGGGIVFATHHAGGMHPDLVAPLAILGVTFVLIWFPVAMAILHVAWPEK